MGYWQKQKKKWRGLRIDPGCTGDCDVCLNLNRLNRNLLGNHAFSR